MSDLQGLVTQVTALSTVNYLHYDSSESEEVKIKTADRTESQSLVEAGDANGYDVVFVNEADDATRFDVVFRPNTLTS